MKTLISCGKIRFAAFSLSMALLVAIISLVFAPSHSRAQVGAWQLNFAVITPGNACANCATPGAPTGCTQPVPPQWAVANCAAFNGFCCRDWVNYNCNTLVLCATGNPIGACPVLNLAQQEAIVNGACP